MSTSKTTRNELRTLLAARGLTPEEAADRTGLPGALVRALHDDPRLLPDRLTMFALGLGLGIGSVEEMLRFDPLERSLSALFGAPGERLRVTVCGAGNLGHVFVGLLGAHPEVEVDLLTSTPERAAELRAAIEAHGGVRVRSRDGEVVGRPRRVSHDAAEVIPGARLVLLCLPSFCEPAVLARIAPHLDAGAAVASIPGVGGVQWAAREILGERAVVFGLASIPWMCKLEEAGARVRLLGKKNINGLATPARAAAPALCDGMAVMLGMPVVDVGNFLQIVFNPGNQLLHPGLMYDLFRDWDGRPLAEPPLFYESVTERGAEVVSAMGDEMLAVRAAIERARPGFDLTAVMPVDLAIRAAYGADIADHGSLRGILRTNRAYAGIRTPMVPVPGGFAPDWSSRFFLEDIPFGLVVVRGIAELAGVPTPRIDEVVRWAEGRMGKRYLAGDRLAGPDVAESGAPQRYGIRSLAALLDGEEGKAPARLAEG
jgi:hypothetical protein